MKITIKRDIEIPDSFFCKGCKALSEYDVESSNYREADCKNFNANVFANKNSDWKFLKCHACVDATYSYLCGNLCGK